MSYISELLSPIISPQILNIPFVFLTLFKVAIIKFSFLFFLQMILSDIKTFVSSSKTFSFSFDLE